MMKNILLIDDEERIRIIFSQALIAEGYFVISVASAAEGYELLKNHEIDLILLDLKMPDVDGGEFYEVFKRFLNKSKVLITSVFPLDEQRQAVPGADEYFDKSAGVGQLLVKVREVLDDTRKREDPHCR